MFWECLAKDTLSEWHGSADHMGSLINYWSDADWKKRLALYAAYDRDKGLRDIANTARAAGQLDGASGKVGVMGFYLGGLMVFPTAAREIIDAAVAYHGGDGNISQ
jgi:carboxymethylenebutenolidase